MPGPTSSASRTASTTATCQLGADDIGRAGRSPSHVPYPGAYVKTHRSTNSSTDDEARTDHSADHDRFGSHNIVEAAYMASSDTAADIMASEDKQMVLKEGLAACSEYTRADMITPTSVTQASSKTKASATNK